MVAATAYGGSGATRTPQLLVCRVSSAVEQRFCNSLSAVQFSALRSHLAPFRRSFQRAHKRPVRARPGLSRAVRWQFGWQCWACRRCRVDAACPLRANRRRWRSYSITSSAVASNVVGMVSPSALAVLRLIAVSYLVGACTGRSTGFAPRRIRST